MPRQFASPTDKVRLYLAAAERRLILQDIHICDPHLLQPIANTPREQPVEISLDDLDDLANYIDWESQRDFRKSLKPKLQQFLWKLRDLLEAHAVDVQSPPSLSNEIAEPAFPVNYSLTQRRVIAECIPEFAERLKLQEQYARSLPLTLAELCHIKKQARRAVVSADRRMQHKSLRVIIETTCKALEKYQEGSVQRISPSKRIYQLRISIVDISPEIWRRIQIRDCRLDRLHELIQLAFGWWNYHLHQFWIGDCRYGDPWLLDDGSEDFEIEDSTQTKISDLVPKDGKRFQFKYDYDFGDNWEHEILFEGCLEAKQGERYPLCLEGERACPPEDVGGTRGYFDYCEAMADPTHEEYKDFLAWRGPYDPGAFDAAKTTKKMRRGMPKPECDDP